jgi:hypothetical protein
MTNIFRTKSLAAKITGAFTMVALIVSLLAPLSVAFAQTAPQTVTPDVSAETQTEVATKTEIVTETTTETQTESVTTSAEELTDTTTTETTTDTTAEEGDEEENVPKTEVLAATLVESELEVASFPELCPENGILTYAQFVTARSNGLITYDLSVSTETGLATVHITNTSGCIVPVSLSVYKMFDQVLSHQEFFDGTEGVNVSGETTLTADLPTCMAQIDFWYGTAPHELLDDNSYGTGIGSGPFVLGAKFIYNNTDGYHNAEGDFCENEVVPPPVVNSCMLPDTLGDETADDIHDSGEKTVQETLDDNGYSSTDAMTDQKQYQRWNVVAGQTVTVDATFLDKTAGHGNVFGYYTNSDLSTFVPLFRKGTAAGYESLPQVSSGDTYTFVVPDGATTLGFAIKSYDGALTAILATENDLNDGDRDRVATYNPESNTYVLAFEDLADNDSDRDFNDMIVKIQIDCTDIPDEKAQCEDAIDNDNDELTDASDPGCHTDGNANNSESYDPKDNNETNDDGGTGGGKAQCVDGVDNDGDDLVDTNDPGCHTDGNADNAASYDPTDNDESNSDDNDNDNGGGGGNGGRNSRRSGGSVPSTPEVLGEAACTEYITSYVKLGKQNDVTNVVRLQIFLNEYMGTQLMTDGVFDTDTYTALKAFQLKEKKEVLLPWVGVTLPNADEGTGWLYKTTKRWINLIKCPELNIPMPELTIDPKDL